MNPPRHSSNREYAPTQHINDFWAEFTDNGTEGKYSWKRIGWVSTGSGSFQEDEKWGEGKHDEDNYAIELDKNDKFPDGLVVWLTPVLGEDFLCFQSQDFFEGRGTATSSGATVSVELKMKSSFTGIVVQAKNNGGFQVVNSNWVMVQYLRGDWILNASKCS